MGAIAAPSPVLLQPPLPRCVCHIFPSAAGFVSVLRAALAKVSQMLWSGSVSRLAARNQCDLKIEICNQKERVLQKRDLK